MPYSRREREREREREKERAFEGFRKCEENAASARGEWSSSRSFVVECARVRLHAPLFIGMAWILFWLLGRGSVEINFNKIVKIREALLLF